MEAFRRVKIDWRRKAFAYRVFDALPAGRTLYYLTQRYVTRAYPRELSVHSKWACEHARTFRDTYRGDLGAARLLEFGAGWDLFNNLVQWCYGVDHQLAIDIVSWARMDQINHAIRYLQSHPPPESVRLPGATLTSPFRLGLREHYGIEYLAPADARAVPLEAGGIDLICTTSVLEHIPAPALTAILQECHRVCSSRSVMSHVIDYTDHYAHADPAITIYNFLRFSEQEWRRFNPDLHFQNRLRHFEYGEMFRAAGFVPVRERAITDDGSDRVIATIPLSDRFRRMEAAQLLPRTAHWVLQKA